MVVAQVRTAVLGWISLVRHLEALGVRVRALSWSASPQAKGVDDALAAGLEVQAIRIEDWLAQWRWRTSEPPHEALEGQQHYEVVRSASEGRKLAEELVADWEPGAKSLMIDGPPGLGKTWAAIEDAMNRLENGCERLIYLALPTAAIAREHARHARRKRRPVRVVNLFGRRHGPEPKEPSFRCLRSGAEVRSAALLGQSPCTHGADGEACPHLGPCHMRGRFLGDLKLAQNEIDEAREDPASRPVLVFLTHAALALHIDKIDSAPIIVDDAGVDLSLFVTHDLYMGDVSDASRRMEVALSTGEGDETVRSVARSTLPVLRAILRCDQGALDRAVRDSDPVVASAEGPFPWEREAEDEDETTPSLTELMLRIQQEVIVHGARAPVLGRAMRGLLQVTLPNRGLIRAAQEGRVAWLGVGDVDRHGELAPLFEWLCVEQVVVRGCPNNLRVIVVEYVGPKGGIESFGVGRRSKNRPSRGPAMVRAVVRAVDQKHGAEAGYVVRKEDRAPLVDAGIPDERIAHYGRDHASTSRLADRGFLVVARYAAPPGNPKTGKLGPLELLTEGLRRAMGIEHGCLLGAQSERCRWPAVGAPLREVRVPADPLTRGLNRRYRAHMVANAIGRSRAMASSEPRTVILLDGRPDVPQLGGAVEVVGWAAFALEYGLPADPRGLAANGAVEPAPMTARERAEAEIAWNPDRGTRDLAIAAGVSEDTIRRARHACGAVDLGDRFGVAWRSLQARVRAPQQTIEDPIGSLRHFDPPLPGPSAVRAGLAKLGVTASRESIKRDLRAIRDGLLAGEAPVPRQNRTLGRRTAVLEVIVQALTLVGCRPELDEPSDSGQQPERRL